MSVVHQRHSEKGGRDGEGGQKRSFSKLYGAWGYLYGEGKPTIRFNDPLTAVGRDQRLALNSAASFVAKWADNRLAVK